MTFSVVIPTYRRPSLLLTTLRSVLACVPLPSEIVVVDGDEARSAETALAEAAQGTEFTNFVYLTTPRGATVQRNAGIEAATGEVVVFLDDDVTIGPDTFALLSEAYDSSDVVGVTGRVIEPEVRRRGGQRSRFRRLLLGGAEGTFTRFGYPRYVTPESGARDVENMLGCFMSARRETAARTRFDENLSGYALCEDEDFACRLSRLGRIRYIPEIVVFHRKTGFLGRNARAFNRAVVTNRYYLFRKNFPQTRLARAEFGLFVVVLLVHRLVNRELQGAVGLLEGAVQAWRTREPARL